MRQLCWVEKYKFAAIRSSIQGDELVLITVDQSYSNVVSEHIIPTEGESLFRLYYGLTSKALLVENEYGQVFKVSTSDLSEPLDMICAFTCVCSDLASCEMGEPDDRQLAVFGLSNRNELFLNNRLVMTGCTSFFIHSRFVIASTLSHSVRFMDLSSSPDGKAPLYVFEFCSLLFLVAEFSNFVLPAHAHFKEAKIEETENGPKEKEGRKQYNELVRRVERGAKIVMAVPGDVNLILQQPRGNLETVYPRALVLASVRDHLDR